MEDTKRQLGIKTRSVKRLAGDVRSYEEERRALSASYQSLQANSATEAHELKRAREFVEEAEATLQDVTQRLHEAFHQLTHFLTQIEHQSSADFLAEQCVLDARAMLESVSPLVVRAAPLPERIFKITVLGDSQLQDDDPMWRPTEELGERLARAGFHVLSGGYSGTSECVSFGASRVSHSCIEGVTCPAAYPSRSIVGAHSYLTSEQPAPDLITRASMLIKPVDACVVMPGGLGTLSKLSLAWNVAAADRLAGRTALAIFAWREPWESTLNSLAQALHMPPALMEAIRFVSSVEEIMQELESMKQKHYASATGASSSSSSAN